LPGFSDLGKQRPIFKGENVTALALVLAASCVAVYTDVTRRRIPNFIVAPLLVAGLALQATHGWQALLQSAALFAAVIALSIPLFSMRIIGGGDVKFLAAASAALGWPDALYFLLYSLLAGGIAGIIFSIVRGRFRSTMAGVSTIAFPLLAGARPAAVTVSAGGSMPYALAIFAGAAALAIRNTVALHLRFPI
jgi:prepilin peptidase CpaA